LENELYRFLTEETTKRDLLSELDISQGNREEFATQLDNTVETYEEISELLTDANEAPIVLSHVPPYNTEADRHHSIGQREMELESAHVGSLALKLALREHSPPVALHGHSHNPAYEPLFDTEAGVHSLNPGFQGIVRISLEAKTGFSFRRLTDGH